MTGYDEAVAWFRERTGSVDDIEVGAAGPETRRHAATIVRAALTEAVPAGRDLTANDVRDAHHDAWGVLNRETFQQSVADFLNRIARPSGGSRRSCVCGDRRDNNGVTHRTDGPCFQSPRSWSLSAPPPDDVTVQDELRRMSGWFGGAARKMLLDRADELDRIGTVVEGEPPAPDPQAAESVCDRMGHDSRDVYEGGEFSHSVCDECGAEMLPDLDDEPQAAEPPRFERGFYRTPDSKQEGPA